MTRTIVDVHVLQTVPPSNLNRDDTGSPKTALYGGVRRARVSSQAWKRAVRLAFGEDVDPAKLGRRTKQVVAELAGRVAALSPELADRSTDIAAAAFKAAGIATKTPKGKDVQEAGYLVFLSTRQYDNLAAAAVKAELAGEPLDGRTAKSLVDVDNSIDIALFGRMVADATDLNVDAACQVAHAISVHGVSNEFDYYTAVDDAKHDADESGAGMIGTVEFNSSTLYRYAAVDADRLLDNLGDPAAASAAVEAFVKAFVTSMPTGKLNTFANRTLPDLVAVRIRSTQPINLVGAFEDVSAVDAHGGRIAGAVARLAAHARDVEGRFGEEPEHAWLTVAGEYTARAGGLGEVLPFKEILARLASTVHERLGR